MIDPIDRNTALGITEECAKTLKWILSDEDLSESERKECEWKLSFAESIISDLKNVPSVIPEPEPCEDAVSRAAVIDLIEASDLDLADRMDNQAVCSFVKMIPSVTPKRKTMICGACSHSDSETLYTTNPPRIQCRKTGNLHFTTDICDCDNMNNQYEISHSDEDAVSRKSILDKIEEVCFGKKQEWVDFRVSQGSNGQRDLIIKFIESLPSIQPKRKTGRWEIYAISMLDGEGCKCPECGFEGMPHWNFCPNCGLKMG